MASREECEVPEGHSVMISDAPKHEEVADAGFGILDTACRYSVAGDRWYQDYLEQCQKHGLGQYCSEAAEDEVYRFGNATKCSSKIRATAPCFIGIPRLVSFSVIPVPSLSLLLGDDFFQQVGGALELSRNLYKPAGYQAIPLTRSARGHRAIDFRPGSFLSIGTPLETQHARDIFATARSSVSSLLRRIRVPLAAANEGSRPRRAKPQRPQQQHLYGFKKDPWGLYYSRAGKRDKIK